MTFYVGDLTHRGIVAGLIRSNLKEGEVDALITNNVGKTRCFYRPK